MSFVPLIIMTVPIIIFNALLSKRKGKNPFIYGSFSIIPLVGFYLAIYLASLTDKSLCEKVDKILSLLENK